MPLRPKAAVASSMAASTSCWLPHSVASELPGTDALLALMAKDKKVRAGALVFVLARGIGKAEIAQGIDIQAVRKTLDVARSNP